MEEQEVGQVDLPLRAAQLLGILIRYRGRNTHCWPGQDTLAKEMGVAERTVRGWVSYLASTGQIEVEKTGRSNRYWIPPRQGTPAETCRSERQKPAGQSGRNLPVRAAETCRSERQKPAYDEFPTDSELNSKKKMQQEADAAAAVPSDLENKTPNPIPALIELGLPDSVLPIAKNDISLADAVLAHAFWRFSTGKPVRSREGYLVGCFRKPGEFGFRKDAAGEWLAPRGESRMAVKSVEQRKADAEAAYQRWKALSEEGREKVFQRAVKAFSFYGYLRRESSTVVSGCVKMMQQMEEEGLLSRVEPVELKAS